MPEAARDHLVRVAQESLPPQFGAAVSAERSPFIQVIFDYAAAIMVTKRIALLGDAAFVVRPHTGMGVSEGSGRRACAKAMRLLRPTTSPLRLPPMMRPVGRQFVLQSQSDPHLRFLMDRRVENLVLRGLGRVEFCDDTPGTCNQDTIGDGQDFRQIG
jgi:hypothetical protein